MLDLNQNLLDGIRRSTIRLGALVGMVIDFLNDEQSTEDDWNAGTQPGTPGVDFPLTTFAAPLNAVATTVTVAATSGFTIGSSTTPGFIIFFDGVNVEVVSYTGSNATQFTGLLRGQYGTTPQSWSIGEFVFQLIFSHGEIPDFDLEIQPRNWTQPAVTGAPPAPRNGSKMVYRPADNSCYVFGGYDGTIYYDDLWKFDLTTNTWTNLAKPTGILRGFHIMEYNPINDQIWLYGGRNAGGNLNDVWKYDFGTATWLTNVAWNHPAAKESAMGAYYEDINGSPRVIVAGGNAGGAPTSTTHIFTGLIWILTASPPFVWAKGDAAWMQAEGGILVTGITFGAFVSGFFDIATASWSTAPATANPPVTRFYPTMVYDHVNSEVLLFGGAPADAIGTNTLLKYNRSTNKWLFREPYSRENRTRHTAAWNSIGLEMITWGGSTDSTGPTFPTFVEPMRFRYYWPQVFFRTQTMDMGQVPVEPGNWELEDVTDTVNQLTKIIYTAEYSDDDIAWNPLGTVLDGDEITELHRYYRVSPTLTNLGIDATPRIQKIDANFDDILWFSMAENEFDEWSTIADFPPIVKSISSLNSKIDLLKSEATIGTVSFDLINTSRQAEALITEHYPRDNTLYIKIGLVQESCPITDFILAFKGRIDDWSISKDVVSFSTKDFQGDLQQEIPEEDAFGAITSIIYNNVSGIAHPVDVIEDILRNQVNIPDRDIDLPSIDVARDDTTLTGWQFNRVLDSPEDAYGLIRELGRHSAVLLIPRENGKVSLKLLDPTQEPVGVWDEYLYNFKNDKLAKYGGTIRNFVSTWWGWNGSGDDFSDYLGAEISTDAASVTNWGRKVMRTNSKWLGNAAPIYAGDLRAQDISDRILALAENGIPMITLETNIAAYPFQVGDLIRVRSSVLESFDQYMAWQARFNRDRDLNFVDMSGRYSLPYRAFGLREAIDMKWWITTKRIDFNRGVIQWAISRAREVPLTRQFTLKADFLEGFGVQIDFETTPDSVQIALNGVPFFAQGTYELIIDMSQQPEQDGAWTLVDTTPSDSTVTYEAWASEIGDFMGEEMPIGAVLHNDAITLKTRWYKIKATLNAATGLLITPTVDEITVTFSEG